MLSGKLKTSLDALTENWLIPSISKINGLTSDQGEYTLGLIQPEHSSLVLTITS